MSVPNFYSQLAQVGWAGHGSQTVPREGVGMLYLFEKTHGSRQWFHSWGTSP